MNNVGKLFGKCKVGENTHTNITICGKIQSKETHFVLSPRKYKARTSRQKTSSLETEQSIWKFEKNVEILQHIENIKNKKKHTTSFRTCAM